MGFRKGIASALRRALAVGAALGAGFLVQSVLMAIVLALASPATLRFFESAMTLHVVPTLFLLLLAGAPLIHTQLPRTASAGITVFVGALGASIPEIYVCTNPHLRCFLTTQTVAGAGMILSGAGCGMVFCLVYRHLKHSRLIKSE
jgi:hypothetical protein